MISFSGVYQWFGAQFQRYVEWNLDRKMEDTGRKMVRRARSLARVRSGRMRDSVIYHYHKSKKELVLVADAPYSEFQEFGTIHFHAHPFIRPAVEYGSKLLGGTGNLGMGFFHTPRLKSRLASPMKPSHFANMEANRTTSTRFNQGAVGRASQYRRSYRGGYGS